MPRLTIVIVSGLLFLTCDTFVWEPPFLEYPFTQEAYFDTERDQWEREILPDKSTPGCFFVFDNQWNSNDNKLDILYYDKESDKTYSGKIELDGGNTPHMFLPSEKERSFILIADNDSTGIDTVLLYDFSLSGDSLDLSLLSEGIVDVNDFPPLIDLGPENYYFENETLHFIDVATDNVRDLSYEVDDGGPGNPAEQFSTPPSTQNIISDYFIPETGAESFWSSTSTFRVERYLFNDDEDVSYYIGFQQVDVGDDYVYIALSYDGSDVEGAFIDYEDVEYYDIIDGGGRLLFKQDDIAENGVGSYTITVTDFDLSNPASIVIDKNFSVRYLGAVSWDGEEKLLFEHAGGNEDETMTAVYSLPLSFFKERQEE